MLLYWLTLLPKHKKKERASAKHGKQHFYLKKMVKNLSDKWRANHNLHSLLKDNDVRAGRSSYGLEFEKFASKVSSRNVPSSSGMAKLESFIEKRRKNAAKDNKYMPYRMPINNG